ncbi:MAG: phosphoribosylanthranilate isomerase [Bacteroidetes bacterium]|nr:phosphoribosylanthranilate isomerase [Rhodothermia bacterium]MCS7155037.1 phosphoribosylanthranilate isomerase [Bacteroidota bacterium]MCX7907321.1 phosphoribosylanthranilate isomerase [Bacteroidota bacterium]MDW8137952.1 phosphoribosylanthranilate isomerase [Bacteroidota bacterium]MDW8286196.1 phosphoribosylanthranilate isomerase [Bacteroidota bacterium]
MDDARLVAAGGADYLGFIFYPQSPRYVEPERVREILAWVHGPEPVGVFVNADLEAILEITRATGIRLVQLHGLEPPELLYALRARGLRVIKAIAVAHDASIEQIQKLAEPYRGAADYLLLDSFDHNLWGGTGHTFNWRLARALAQETPLFLAGGIGPDNLVLAAQTVRPFALDVNSRLEVAPGRKDGAKLQALFAAWSALEAQEHV